MIMARVTEEILPAALEQLARVDADLARACRDCGPPPLRAEPPGFGTLLRTVVGQQVSVAAASAIWTRLLAAAGDAAGQVAPEAFLALDEDDLKAVGFSRRKMDYGAAMAEDLVTGRVDLAGLDGLDDEAAIAELVKLKGIGRWTAEVYLLFAHGRPDVWPADDLGLMSGVALPKNLPARPDAHELRRIAEPWRPWRGVAARLVWHARRQPGLAEDKRKPG